MFLCFDGVKSNALHDGRMAGDRAEGGYGVKIHLDFISYFTSPWKIVTNYTSFPTYKLEMRIPMLRVKKVGEIRYGFDLLDDLTIIKLGG